MHCQTTPGRRASSLGGSLQQTSPSSAEHQVALEKLFDRVCHYQALPYVVERILEMSQEPLDSTAELLAVIRSDAALTTNILRQVNSSYTGLTRRVSNLENAVNLLGITEVRNIALTVFMSRMFDSPARYGTYSREALWKHCYAVAIAARKLARLTGKAPTDDAYLAGLLHHLGTILIDQYLRRYFCQIIKQVDETTPTYLVERRILSFDQSQLSAHVAKRWRFSKSVCDAVRYYRYPAQYTGPHRHLVHTVALADFLCSRAGLTSFGVHNIVAPDRDAFALLGLDRVSLAIIWDEVQSTISGGALL